MPAPGVDVDRIGAYKDSASQSGGILQYLQLFSGGALTNLAVFALGIMPYITSSIIMQILGVVVPKIEQWQQQGAVGQRKITQWTRYLAIAISLVQGTSFAFLLHGGATRSTSNTPSLIPVWNAGRVALLVATFTAGTALLDVVRRARYATRHRQRHVAVDLRVDRQPPPGAVLAPSRQSRAGGRWPACSP